MISVLMPVFNADKFLKKSIESILNQTLKKFEFLIFNDSSNDQSFKIIQYFAKKDKRIRYFNSNKNIGISKALNFLATKIKYKFIARMDSDDVSHPLRFQKQYDFLSRNLDYSAVGSYVNIVNEDDHLIKKLKFPLSSKDIKKELYQRSCLPHPGVMLNGDYLNKINFYRPILETAEDYDLWSRLAIISNLANLPYYLLTHRINNSGISNSRAYEQYIKTQFVKLNYWSLKNTGKDILDNKNITHIDEKKLLEIFPNNFLIFLKLKIFKLIFYIKNFFKIKKINFFYFISYLIYKK